MGNTDWTHFWLLVVDWFYSSTSSQLHCVLLLAESSHSQTRFHHQPMYEIKWLNRSGQQSCTWWFLLDLLIIFFKMRWNFAHWPHGSRVCSTTCKFGQIWSSKPMKDKSAWDGRRNDHVQTKGTHEILLKHESLLPLFHQHYCLPFSRECLFFQGSNTLQRGSPFEGLRLRKAYVPISLQFFKLHGIHWNLACQLFLCWKMTLFFSRQKNMHNIALKSPPPPPFSVHIETT